MTLQHSPGPWTYDKIRRSIIDGRDKPICEMTQYSCEGDLDVLLAAPDMLRLLRMLARVPLEQARLGIGPKAAIKEARKMLQELDGDT